MIKRYKTSKKKRKERTRAKIKGTPNRPRLSVFRSNKAIYAQLIDDDKGITLVSAREKKLGKKTKIEQAQEAGKILAERALKKKIKTVVFDRGQYRYHGRVKALAEGARKGGLKF